MTSLPPARIERYRRRADGGWDYDDITQGGVDLVSGAKLDVGSLYTGLPD